MKSLYELTYTFNEDIKNQGYDYKGKILKNSLSSYLYNFKHIADFLNYLELPVHILYESTKILKTYYNYTVDKKEKLIN